MFKIAVDNIVQVPVKFTLKDGSVNKLFTFTLTATRRTQDQIEEQPDLTVKDFLMDNVSDWSGQRLVLGDNGEPAAFSRDALEFMLKQPGLLGIVWAAYTRECGGKEKN